MMKHQRDAGLIVFICIILGVCLVQYVIWTSKPRSGIGLVAAPIDSDPGREDKRLNLRDVPETLRPVIILRPFSDKLYRLIHAIGQVESGEDYKAVGDGGKSLGWYQISRAYWQDACEYGEIDWDYDIFVRSKFHSEDVMVLYWQRYGATTDEERARIHNGGPRGMSKKATIKYWNKVQEAMK